MSIDLVRVDNRLIHGQILEAWVPFVHADHIVVVDNEAATDDLKRSILELATPSNIKLEIVTIQDAIRMYNEGQFAGRCIVLFSGPCQAYEAYLAGFAFQSLNVGNVHFATGKTRVSRSVCVNREEMDVLQELARLGVEVELRAVPREASKRIGPDGEPSSE